MANDDDSLNKEAAQLAIAKAAEQTPKIQMMRQKLLKMAGDDDKGLEMLANAIRKMLHQD